MRLKGLLSEEEYAAAYSEKETKLNNLKNDEIKTTKLKAKLVSNRETIKEMQSTIIEHALMKEFDGGLFNILVEKVIVGGYKDDGNYDPYRLTFVFKGVLANNGVVTSTVDGLGFRVDNRLKKEANEETLASNVLLTYDGAGVSDMSYSDNNGRPDDEQSQDLCPGI